MILTAISDYANAQYLLQFFIDNAGYWLVFLFMVIESSFLPFPSEVVVPPAAYLAVTKGDMNVFLIVLVATAGAVVGALINYFLSVWLGRPIVYAFANSRLGHACLIDQAKVEKAEKYFDKHGGHLNLYRASDSCCASVDFHPGRTGPYEYRCICDFHCAWCNGLELHIGGPWLLAWQNRASRNALRECGKI